MKERFKTYLEAQFRQIAPTKSAMEYRISLLEKMLDRAQELRIKGMNDDELIYNTVVSELGDLSETLRGYENKVIKRAVNGRIAVTSALISVAYVLALVMSYIIVGTVAHIWHPTWLIIVGGILLAVAGLLVYVCAVQAKRKLYLLMRVTAVGATVLVSVIVFLLLQLVGGFRLGYLVFLAMVALIATVDAVIAFASGSKIKWIELPLAVEVVCVMLYVMLGISLAPYAVSFWHPGWVLCLGGAVVAMIELIVLAVMRTSEKKKEEKEENTAVDESYWSRWE